MRFWQSGFSKIDEMVECFVPNFARYDREQKNIEKNKNFTCRIVKLMLYLDLVRGILI